MPDTSSRAFQLIRKAFLIAFATTLITLVIPGWVAHRAGIFDERSMAEHITPRLGSPLRDQLSLYQKHREDADRKLVQIDDAFVGSGQLTNEQISALNAQYIVAERLQNATPPVKFLPFYLSSAMLLWVLSLTPLAWLALLFYPGASPFESLRYSEVLGAGLLAYVSYQWTVWMRYFVLGNSGRKVVGFANYDVSHAGFWLQEINTVLFWLLLSSVCFQWLHFSSTIAKHRAYTAVTLTSVTNGVSNVFLRWQLTSLMLVLSFLPFTTFYWDLIVHAKDGRFLPAAIILHTLWAVAWIIVSIPLFRSWSEWRTFKAQVLERALVGDTSADVIRVLEASEPIGDWSKVISGALTTLSFGAPLLKALLS
ncbi:MAG: hypothetical protein ABSE44_03990 [Candidatus Sulfotelmatobacter sp.]